MCEWKFHPVARWRRSKCLGASSAAAALILLACALGCADRNTPEAPPETVQAPVEEAQPTQRPGDSSRLTEVDWEDARHFHQIALDRLDDGAQKVAADAPVPLLLPDDEQLLGSAHITLGEAWYVASMSGDDHSVVFNGTHRAHEIPGVSGKKEELHQRPTEHTITRTHGIVTMTFEEFGVAYAVDVECERPLENELCTGDEYVISLVEGAGVLEGTSHEN